jgi:branched-chain amino acid transport system ATP-binding protein
VTPDLFGPALLEVRGLCGGYAGVGGGTAVLHDVSLSVPRGAVVAVLGANGAGKTTLLRTLAGLLPATAGTITLDGADLARLAVERRVRLGVGYVPQGLGVVAELSVADNLRLGALGRAGAEAARALAWVYELFEPLAQRRGLAAHHLSGGERQMLAIGRALVAGPRLLLLDEPSLGLAPETAARIMTLLRTLCDTIGLAVLLVEQNVRGALGVADGVVVMALGRVVATGPPAGPGVRAVSAAPA